MSMAVAVGMRMRRRWLAARRMQGASTAYRANELGAIERLVDNFADGARAAPALRTASQAAIDMTGRTAHRTARGLAHVVVAQYVAGTDDHPGPRFSLLCCRLHFSLMAHLRNVKEKRSLKTF